MQYMPIQRYIYNTNKYRRSVCFCPIAVFCMLHMRYTHSRTVYWTCSCLWCYLMTPADFSRKGLCVYSILSVCCSASVLCCAGLARNYVWAYLLCLCYLVTGCSFSYVIVWMCDCVVNTENKREYIVLCIKAIYNTGLHVGSDTPPRPQARAHPIRRGGK